MCLVEKRNILSTLLLGLQSRIDVDLLMMLTIEAPVTRDCANRTRDQHTSG